MNTSASSIVSECMYGFNRGYDLSIAEIPFLRICPEYIYLSDANIVNKNVFGSIAP